MKKGTTPTLFTRAACWLLSAVVLAPMIFFPLTRDSGLFAYVGRIILDGGFPYRDVFEQKGPGIHYTYALAMAVFGATDWGVRVFFYLLAVAGAQLAAGIGARMYGSAARIPCALCFALAMFEGDKHSPWRTAQAEDVITLLMLGVLSLLGTENGLRSAWRVALAGATLGLTCWFKPTAFLPAALTGVVALVFVSRHAASPVAAAAKCLGAAWAGFIVPVIIFRVYFGAHGVWDDFWVNVVKFNASSYAAFDVGRSLVNAFGLVDARWRGLLLLAIPALLLTRSRCGVASGLLWASLIGHWLAVIAQGKYFIYHWTPMIGCIAILAGGGVAAMMTFFQERWGFASWSRLFAPCGAAAVAFVAAPADPAHLVQEWWPGVARIAVGKQTIEGFRSSVWTGSAKHEISNEVARYLKERTDPDDTVLIWGHETVVNFEADRRSPTRFSLDAFLSMEGPFRDEFRKEFLSAVRANPPAYIVVLSEDTTPMELEESREQLRRFTEFAGFVEREYVEERKIGNFSLMRRRE